MHRIIIFSIRIQMKKSLEQNWCSMLHDHLNVSQLSIPGTHDSAAHEAAWYTRLFPFMWQTQQMSISQQLCSGVRYFDIRIKFLPNSQLLLVHDKVELGLLSRATRQFSDFLTTHPLEFVIMQVQRESSEQDQQICSERFMKFVQDQNLPVFRYNGLPCVKEMRGKIWVIQTNFCVPSAFSLQTYTPNIVIDREKYILQNLWRGPRQQKLLQFHRIFKTTDSEKNNKKLKVNFINESISLRYPSRKKISQFYNQQMMKLSEQLDDNRAMGIVIMDYPSKKNILTLIMKNKFEKGQE